MTTKYDTVKKQITERECVAAGLRTTGDVLFGVGFAAAIITFLAAASQFIGDSNTPFGVLLIGLAVSSIFTGFTLRAVLHAMAELLRSVGRQEDMHRAWYARQMTESERVVGE